MLIDSHAHLSSFPLSPTLNELIERAQQAGIEKIVNICTGAEDLEWGLRMRDCYRNAIFTAAALTPHNVAAEGEKGFAAVKEAAYQDQLVAIGETGLDYYNSTVNDAQQKASLCRHLQLALTCRLPVIIHCREAFEDLWQILDREYCNHPHARPGIIHCFTGQSKDAAEAIKRGWMISVSGILTFKKSEELRAVVSEIPLEHLIIETDTPYLAPLTSRGKQNEPAFLVETAQVLGQIKGICFELIAEITRFNTQKVFAPHLSL